ncbi:MAG: PstC family ABC transporter permease [Oscillochloridaceae bacterium umkhey_bin13]
MTSFIAMCVAIPLGVGTAIYLSEYASERARSILKPMIELLAGIPTVVYGYFALTFVTPWLREIFGRDVVSIYNNMSAGLVVGVLITPVIATVSTPHREALSCLVVGVLITPVIATLSEDALSAVPHSLRQASC